MCNGTCISVHALQKLAMQSPVACCVRHDWIKSSRGKGDSHLSKWVCILMDSSMNVANFIHFTSLYSNPLANTVLCGALFYTNLTFNKKVGESVLYENPCEKTKYKSITVLLLPKMKKGRGSTVKKLVCKAQL